MNGSLFEEAGCCRAGRHSIRFYADDIVGDRPGDVADDDVVEVASPSGGGAAVAAVAAVLPAAVVGSGAQTGMKRVFAGVVGADSAAAVSAAPKKKRKPAASKVRGMAASASTGQPRQSRYPRGEVVHRGRYSCDANACALDEIK